MVMAIQFNREQQVSVIITECKTRYFSSLSGEKKKILCSADIKAKEIDSEAYVQGHFKTKNGCLKKRLLISLARPPIYHKVVCP